MPRPCATTQAPGRTVHRYYDPTTGEFLTVDPLVAATGQPFSYAGNDPVNASDPSGLEDVQGVACAEHLPYCQSDGGTSTGAICLNGEAAWGAAVNASICIGVVDNQPVLIITLGSGGGSPSAAITLGTLATNATCIQDLKGWFANGGGSAGEGAVAGVDIGVGKGRHGKTITTVQPQAGVGANLPVPGEFHAGSSYTWVFKL